ncbi:hypothetical protein, partial [Vibrio sp. S11_S32]|uniref:hypothetical protein n=1 Tax=Vibrio sp. S11_S32 TaxID=2720225 RepID=UPI001EEEFFFB
MQFCHGISNINNIAPWVHGADTKEQLGTTFSIGTISEAQTKVASMLTVTHQAVKLALQKSPLIH